MNDRLNEREARVRRKIGRGAKLTIVVLIAVAFVVLFVLVLPIEANGTDCEAPEGYSLVNDRMAYDLAGNPVFVVRGVIATGEGTAGGREITLPPCGSKDFSLTVINNVFIILDGKQVFLAAGSVGRDLSANPTAAPQP